MKTKLFIILVVSVFMTYSCNKGSKDGYTHVKVVQVEHVDNYTYLLVKQKGSEFWIAVERMNAQPGEKYKYYGGMQMENFYSEQLAKTFDKILFLENLLPESAGAKISAEEYTPGSMIKNEKEKVTVDQVEGSISIMEIYADKKKLEGDTIRVRGKVTRFNSSIMERNWVHIQDGTEFDGKFDLAVTSNETFEVGSTVIIEGIVTLDHDFGYGYSYEILIENARKVEEDNNQ